MSTNPNYTKGLELYKNEQYREAVVAFTKAIESEENPYIYYERGLSYFHLHQTEKSLEDLEKALELQPENPFRWSSRAYVKDKLGDTEGAINDYKKAIELDPKDAVAYNNLGLLEEKRGWKEKAKQNFAKADQLANVQNLTAEPIRDKTPEEKAAEAEPEEKSENTGLLRVIKGVFTSSDSRKEFVSFVKNGFKIKP